MAPTNTDTEQVKRNEGDGEEQPLYEGGGTMVCKDDFQIGHKQSSSSGSVQLIKTTAKGSGE